MKVKFLATGTAPDMYTISGEIVNGIDLSIIEHGGKFIGSDDTRAAGIRNAERDENNELWVTLKQEVGAGHWREGEWIEAGDYDPEVVYVVKLDKPHAGKAWVKNGKGEKIYG